MSCDVVCKLGSDTTLLWLWCRPAATAPTRPLAWEPPYAVGTALKRQEEKKRVKTILNSQAIQNQVNWPCTRVQPMSFVRREITLVMSLLTQRLVQGLIYNGTC